MTKLVQEPSTCSMTLANQVKNTQLKVAAGKHNVGGDFWRLAVLNETPGNIDVLPWMFRTKHQCWYKFCDTEPLAACALLVPGITS